MDEQTEETIFDCARRIESAQERCAYLERACQHQPELLRRVNRLLEVNDRQDALESDPPGLEATALQASVEKPGMIVNGYKLMEQIGEGGMGVVYVAEQTQPIRRRVALKVIKPGMDSKEVVARFEAERQALALMDHPNIAKVHDAGATESGRPYFVMELVRGISLTEYCDLNKLGTRTRLKLFGDVCHAVQHAHQKGVIHRDIKPSNVLVTEHDGTPVVKVIDFGVAKAINQQLTEVTVYTRFQQMVGTPLYMSPEQAELSGLDVDTRSDIYSLGVLLYELLTGATPFDKERLKQAAFDEIRRIIREEEPSKPSTKVRSLGKTAGTISAYRTTDPRRLRQSLQGDLDWIVMKALEKDRSRRYDTSKDFARDIERHLNDEPIAARPPSSIYRLRKMFRRHRVACVAATAVLASLAVGFVMALWGWTVANEEHKVAEIEREKAVSEKQIADEMRLVAERATDDAANQHYNARIIGADEALRQANYFLARRTLDRISDPQRKWEWHYLDGRLRSVFPHTFKASRQPHYTQDGRHLIAIGSGRSSEARFIKTWNMDSGNLANKLEHHTSLTSLALSNDEQLIAAGDESGCLMVWRAETGEALKTIQLHAGEFFAGLDFSPDGQLIASANQDKTIKVVDWEKGELLFTLGPFEDAKRTRKVMFSPDGRWLLAGMYQGQMPALIIDVNTGKIVARFPQDGGDALPTFDPSGRRIATTSANGSVRLWDWDGRKLTLSDSWPASAQRSRCLSFSPDGGLLACSDYHTGVCTVWDVKTQEKRATLQDHGGVVNWSTFSPDGTQMALSTGQGVRLWSFGGGQRGKVAKAVAGYAHVEISPDGELIVASGSTLYGESSPGSAVILDANTLEEFRRCGDDIRGATWSTDGREIVASADAAAVIAIHSVLTGKELERFPVGSLRSARLNRSARRLTALSSDGSLRVLNPETKSLTLERRLQQSFVLGAGWSRDGHRLALERSGGHVQIWDVESNSPLAKHVLGNHWGFALAFSDDGERVFAGGSDGLLLEMTSSDSETHRFYGHSAHVTAVQVSPSQRKLVSGDMLGRVIIWDIASKERLLTIADGGSKVTSVDWSVHNNRVVTGHEDGTIRTWTFSFP